VNRLTRILPVIAGIFGAALILACTADVTGPGTTPQFAQAGAPGSSEFTECSPQPSASAKARIGPDGGSLRAGDHVLIVPAGALKAATWITMQAPSGEINRVVFGPEGLTFHRKYPARLVMSYQDCMVNPGAEQQIVQVNESLSIIETPPSENDPLTETVGAKLSHFSDYVQLSTYAVVY
jgi:hypothetical protein